jgi:hypothetical protein
MALPTPYTKVGGGLMSYMKGLMFDERLLLGESKIILKAENSETMVVK